MSDIRKRNGKTGTTYQVRYRDQSSKTGYSYKTFRTLKESRLFREDSRFRESSSPMNPEIKTVQDSVNLWLKICDKEGLNGREPITNYTLKNYQYRADYIKLYPWNKSLRKITAPDVVEFRSWLLQRGMSRDLARKILATLQSVIKEMTLRGHISNNVAAGISIRNESRYAKPVAIPSRNDIQELLRAADRLSNSKNLQISKTWEKYRPILYLAVDSGMRPQEYLAVSGLSLKKNGIQVERAIDGSGHKISVTKTPAGRRFIELSDETLAILRHYLKNHTLENKHDLIFPTQTGKWQCRKNWQRRGFNIACEEAGLMERCQESEEWQPKYRPYDLRHFYASMLFDKKVNLKKIQTLMGHTNIETTLNVYGHLLEDDSVDKSRQSGILSDIGVN